MKRKRGLLIYCVRCGNLLAKPGALLLTPPEDVKPDGLGSGMSVIRKLHLCCKCWRNFEEIFLL
jgi:hypothetical protein